MIPRKRPSRLRQRALAAALIGMALGHAEASAQDAPAFLDEIEGKQALAWVAARNQHSFDTLQADPRYQAFYNDALAVTQSADRLPKPSFLGGRIWNFWQDSQHPRGIWRNTTLASYRSTLTSWTTRLDVDALAKHDHSNWVFHGADCLEPEERRCLIGLSDAGEDAKTLREYDTRAGKFRLDGFILPRSKQSVAWVDENTLLVGRDWDGAGTTLTASGYPFVIRGVRRGEGLDQAVEVARGEKGDVAVTPLALTDGDGNRLLLIQRATSFFVNRYAILETSGLRWLDIPGRSELEGLLHGRLILALREDWSPMGRAAIPAGSVVSIDPAAPTQNVQIVFTPGANQAVDEVAVTRNTVVATVLENVRGKALVLTPGTPAWHARTLPLPDMATVHIADVDKASDAAFLTVEGYIQPSQLWLVGPDASAEKIREMPPLFDASALEVEQLWATSTDGTRIPYFVVHRKDMVRNGQNPTLLTAYGGFQLSSTPLYAPEIGRLWLNQGGVYVMANIRGGGEFGPAWHEAGRKTQRQRVFDDFAAVGRDLVARHITSVPHLGIRGRSNGGLLMGVEFTQHPELWHAVIIGVPLLDMLHFETMAAGASWVDEYGSVSVPAEREFLEKISPLSYLRADVTYPEPFIFTSTKDDRVGPVHARRFAARMAELGKPFFYYEDVEGGHSGTANVKEVAHECALEAVYLAQKLKDAPGR